MKNEDYVRAVLPYQEIIKSEIIKGTPNKDSPYFNDCFQPSSYDMRIGAIISGEDYKNKEGDEIFLESGGIATIITIEEVHLPLDICATVFPPNFLSLQGVLILNPGHVDPGFEGPLTARIINLQKTKLHLRVGDRIITIVFQYLSQPTSKPYEKKWSSRELRELEIRRLSQQSMAKAMFELERDRLRETLRRDFVDKRDFFNFFIKNIFYLGSISYVLWSLFNYIKTFFNT